jgi:acyl-CoA synthetase (AMP-forming)/AMP-acid ligase II
VQCQAESAPERPFHHFLRDGTTSTLTFGELWKRSGAIAATLQSRGIAAGQIVIVSMPMGPDLLAGFLGAMRAGAIPTIMPYPNPKQKEALFWGSHSQLFEHIDPAAFFLSEPIADLYDQFLPQYSARLVRPREIAPATPIAVEHYPDAIAFLQHSSGTTSLKKGVRLSHGAVVDHVRGYARQCGIHADSRLFSWLPLYHDMGLVACLLMPLVVGCCVTAIDNFEWVARPSTMLKAIGEYDVEFAWMPNFGFAHLMRSCPDPSQFELSSLRALINCSEPCRPEMQDRFTSHFAPAGLSPTAVQVCYAMAENVFAVTQTDFSRPAPALALDPAAFDRGQAVPTDGLDRNIVIASCGRPMADTAISIVDDNRNAVPEGTIGEVAIRSASLFAGYNGRPDLTANVLVGGTYYSGDLGFIRDGELYLTGRKDDLILAYGRNLLAHELEALVNTVEGVRPGRVTVFGVDSPQTSTTEIAVMAETIVGTEKVRITRGIRAALDAGAGVSPRQIVLLSDGELLKTTSGKISRSANRAAYIANHQAG